MSLKDTYNKIANDWHRDHQNDDWWVEGTDMFCSMLPSGGTVLDVGCAGGVKSRYLVAKGLHVTGIDFSENFIEIAKKEVPEGEFYVMDMRDISALPQTYDGIFCQAALLHIPKSEVPHVVQGWLPKLNTNGLLYIAVKRKREGQPEEGVLKENDYGYEYERFFSYFTPQEIEALFTENGFEIVFKTVAEQESSWIQVVGKRK